MIDPTTDQDALNAGAGSDTSSPSIATSDSDQPWDSFGASIAPRQRHSFVLKLVMSVFALVVVLPWIAAAWIVTNMFSLIAIAEILEDGQALGPVKFENGTLLAIFGLCALIVHRVRRAYRQNRREREQILAAAAGVEDSGDIEWLHKPGLWERWGPSLGSIVFGNLFFVVFVLGLVLLENPLDFPAIGTKMVGVLLLFFFMGLVWIPWKALNWSWSVSNALHKFGMTTMWRNGLLTGLLITGVLTLNPAVLPISLGVGSAMIFDALGGGEVAQSAHGDQSGSYLVPAQARPPRPGARQSADSGSLRELFAEVGRQTDWGNEPARPATPAPRRTTPTATDAVTTCFQSLYSATNAEGRTEYQMAMRRVHRQRIGHPDDEDIVHGAMVRVCDHHANVRSVQRLGPYFNRTVRNAIVDHRNRTARLFPLPEQQDGYDYRDVTHEDRISAIALRNAFNELTPQQKSALELYAQGNSYTQIADELGTSLENARQLVSRARSRIR
jgi:RNA polymerase sigma factor (sigma-70 family)